jgi:hypothetical protein
MDITKLSDQQLRNLIDNHRRKGATDHPIYLEAIAENDRRRGKGLSFSKSIDVIRKAAAEGRFVSYKELAEKSGADWNQVRYLLGKHLWSLVEYAQGMGWPMLSAIVVNKENLASGAMEAETLKGFIAAAKDLKPRYVVTNEEQFLREQQKLVFEWGRKELPSLADIPAQCGTSGAIW